MNVKLLIKVKSTNKTPLFPEASKNREEGGGDTVRTEKERKASVRKSAFTKKYIRLGLLDGWGNPEKHIKAELGFSWPAGKAEEGAPRPCKHLFPVLCQIHRCGPLSACVRG